MRDDVQVCRSRLDVWSRALPATMLLALVPLLPPAGAASAQGTDCNQLYAAIQAADNGGGGNRWSRAADQQRAEMARTQRYADQLGCGRGGGLFGGGAAPQCAALDDRLQRMQDNVSRMEAAADQAPPDESGARRQAMVARYNALCVAGNPADVAARDGGGYAPVNGQNPADLGADPLDPDRPSDVPPGGDIMNGDTQGQRLGQAICVRTCDGGYFPLSPRATQDRLGDLEQLCQASCPNTEAKLYTMGRSGDLSSATSADGAPYSDLPAAFKFEKTFTPTCSCKPPGQSWVQALAQAETLLGDTDRHDVTVTASLSDQMSRPGAVPPAKGKGVKTVKGGKSLPLPALAPPLPDLSALRDSQKGLQAPTASNESTGIGGPVNPERVVPRGSGPTVSMKAPDGSSRQIRLIVP